MKRARKRCAGLGCVLAAALNVAPTAAAEPTSLGETRSTRYYQIAGGATAVGFGLAGLSWLLFKEARSGSHWETFEGDGSVERHFNHAAAGLSDDLLLASLLGPVGFEMGHGIDITFANTTLVHAQAHALDSLLGMTVKLVARRQRPYMQSSDPSMQRFARSMGADASMSFYSGHTSAAFTAATAGSILYSARSELSWARHTLWGLEYALAGVTAQLRVCSGRHYRTDVWAGALAGIGVGVLVPWLNDVELKRIRPSELGVAAGATVATWGLTAAVDFCGALRSLGVHDPPPPAPFDVPGEESGRWFIAPAALHQGFGVQLIGEL